MENPILDAARAKREKHQKALEAILEAPTSEKRELTDDEMSSFEERTAKIVKLDDQIRALEAEDARRTEAAAKAAEVVGDPAKPSPLDGIRSEPTTYSKWNRDSKRSYLFDLAALQTGAFPEARDGAAERMRRHTKEIQVDMQKDPELALRWQEAEWEMRTNPNTTAGTGGELVPPLWLVSQYVPYLRPTRTFANRVHNMALPPGIDVINIPKITVGSTTAIQSANAAPVSSTDIQTTSVSASVNTIAGQEDISLQLLEQSPIAMDGVVFNDLTRDYDQRLDLQVIAGTGSNGQHLGVLSVTQGTSNTNIQHANGVTVSSATFFDGSTAGTQYRSVVNGVNSIETLRFAPPTAIWVHPRRANSWAYAGDSATAGAGRPLFIPAKYGQYNTVGTFEGAPVPEGIAGELFGLPVVKDGNMPTTMSGTAVTGGTADAVVVLKEDDLYLWEGTLKLRALPEILSGTLQIRYQVYAYSAFLPTRFPPSISILTGNTGLAAPGF